MKHKQFTQEEIITILLRVKSGEHPIDIAREIEVTGETVKGWCRKAGLQYKRKERHPKVNWEKVKATLEHD
jgi:hypothetical protein